MTEEKFLEFTTKIKEKLKKNGKFFVELEETYFYPDGKGGQLGDRGKIENANVLSVIEEDSKVLHEVDTLDLNEEVKCRIDKERRKEISREHTAQHILSQAFIVLHNLETVSFHMGENYSTIDLNGILSSNEEFEKVELLANNIVLEDRLVKKYFVSREDLENLDLRKKIEIEGPIRVVEIENFDKSLCGGTHVDKTGEIGIIKIFKTEKIKGNLTRVYFSSGFRALKIFQKKVELIDDISRNLTTGEGELAAKIVKIMNENKSLFNRVRKLEEKLIKEILSRLKGEETIKEILEEISRKGFETLAFKLKDLKKEGYLMLIGEETILLGVLNRSLEIPYKSYTVNEITFYNIEISKKEEVIKLLNEIFGG